MQNPWRPKESDRLGILFFNDRKRWGEALNNSMCLSVHTAFLLISEEGQKGRVENLSHSKRAGLKDPKLSC